MLGTLGLWRCLQDRTPANVSSINYNSFPDFARRLSSETTSRVQKRPRPRIPLLESEVFQHHPFRGVDGLHRFSRQAHEQEFTKEKEYAHAFIQAEVEELEKMTPKPIQMALY